ncbi:MAG: phage portal protein [Sulfuriferula sp.]
MSKRLKTAAQIASKRILMPNGKPAMMMPTQNRFDAMRPLPTARQVPTQSSSVEQDDIISDSARKQMVSLGRDAANNFGLVRGLVRRLTDFVVGSGNRLICSFEDEKLNSIVENYFNKQWSRQCDARGRQSLWELQASLFRRWYIDGDSFIYFRPDGKIMGIEAEQVEEFSGWKQLLPADYIDSHPDLDKWRNRQGIVVDTWDSPRHYCINRRAQSTDASDYLLVSYEWMQHVAEFDRFRQVRGISQLLTVVRQLADLNTYFKAELEAAKSGAKLAVFIASNNPSLQAEVNTHNITDTDDATGVGASTVNATAASLQESAAWYQRMEDMQAGAVVYGRPGEKPEMIESKRPAAQFGNFVNAVVRQFGSSQSVPLELLMLDFSQTNFSSSKAAMLLAWSYISNVQTWYNRVSNQYIAEHAIQSAMDNKQLPQLPIGWQNNLSFSNPTLPQVNRSQEEYARQLGLDNGTTNLELELQGSSDTWQEIQDQRHREKMRLLQFEALEMQERIRLKLPMPSEQQPNASASASLTKAIAQEIAGTVKPKENNNPNQEQS